VRPSGCPPPLLPRYGVTWAAIDEETVTASYRLDSTPIELRCSLDPLGRLRSVVFDRWGDPDNMGSWGFHRFGFEVTGYRTFVGLTIPAGGRAGWHFGSDRWPEGEFFRSEITSYQVITRL
jgi:hypothetical protein